MKKLFIIFIFVSGNIFSQSRTIDSLNSVLKNSKHDTIRAAVYVALANEFYNTKSDTIISISEKALGIIKNLSVNIAQKKSIQTLKSDALSNIGSVYYKKGEMTKAIDFFDKSLKIYEEIGNKKGIATSLNNIGAIYIGEGNHTKALDYNFKALKMIEEVGDKAEIANTLNNIGIIYDNLGDNQKSLNYYLRSLNLRLEVKDSIGIALALSNIAIVHVTQGNIVKALEYHMKSLRVRERLKDMGGIAESLYNLGFLYQSLDDIPKCIYYFQKSLKQFSEINDSRGKAASLSAIGTFYYSLGDYKQALTYFQNSLKINEEIGDKKGIALLLNNIGSIYQNQGNNTEAITTHQKSLKINEEIGNKSGTASSLNNIGVSYALLGQLQEAMNYLQKSLKIRGEMEDKNGITGLLNNIADVFYKQKNYPNAIQNCSRSLKMSVAYNLFQAKRAAAKTLYRIYCKVNLVDSASYYLSYFSNLNNKSLSNKYITLSEKEKEFYFAKLEKDYMMYYDFAASYGNKIPNLKDTAYNISLTKKGLTLKSSTAMRTTILNSGDTILIKNYEEWRETKKKILKLYEKGKDTKELDDKANELEKELIKKSNVFADFDKVKSLDWKQIKKSLKKEEASIEFVHFKSEIDSANPTKYAALIVKPESLHPEMITLFNEKDLIKILGSKPETGTDYITNIYGKRNKSNSQLYDLIWKPMEKSLKGAKTIYYSPSGLLHKISFAALSKGKDVYLCDNHRLELQGSTGKLAMLEKFEFNRESTVGIFGDINYDTPETLKDTTALLSWPYLEGTKTEAEKVAAILKTNNLKYDYVAGKSATESEFKNKAPQNNIVHIATHGFFFPEPDAYSYAEKQDSTNKETQIYRSGDRAVGVYNFIINKNPLMRSGLVFAGANEVWSRKEYADKEDGVLTAQEVATLDLRKTNLVVLSACETGLGDVKGTEGVYGLQRSLKMAGVKFIIMSLWQVPDAETVEFMEKFYIKLTKTKDIKISFYETRNEMRKKYDPFYWAAFVLLE